MHKCLDRAVMSHSYLTRSTSATSLPKCTFSSMTMRAENISDMWQHWQTASAAGCRQKICKRGSGYCCAGACRVARFEIIRNSDCQKGRSNLLQQRSYFFCRADPRSHAKAPLVCWVRASPLIGWWEICQLEILLFNYLLIEAIMFVLLWVGRMNRWIMKEVIAVYETVRENIMMWQIASNFGGKLSRFNADNWISFPTRHDQRVHLHSHLQHIFIFG